MARRDIKRVNGELFTFTYGALVAQLIKDYESDDEVNKQLDKMGYNIGVRIIDDYLAHTGAEERCQNFQETCTILAKEGFRMFLGITPTLSGWSPDGKECSLILTDNPLTAFVELPEAHSGLQFCNILTGVIRGALEMVQLRVDVSFVRDALKGDDATEIRLKFLGLMEDEAPPEDD